MNHQEEFDELARRKLEERSFPFQEAHWLKAKQVIDAERRGRRWLGAGLIGGISILLLFIGSFWYKGHDADRTVAPVIAEVNVEKTGTQEIHLDAEEVPGKDMDAADDRLADRTGPKPVNSSVRTDEGPESVAATKPGAVSMNEKGTSSVRPGSPVPDRAAQVERTSAQLTTERLSPRAIPAEGSPNKEEADLRSSEFVAEVATLSVGAIRNDEAAVTSGGSGSSELSPIATIEGTGAALPVPVKAEAEDGTPSKELSSVVIAEELVMVGVEQAGQETTEALIPQDSLETLPAVLSTPPLVPDAAPWELGIVAGIFSSTSQYSGGNSADWGSSVERLWTPAIGVEFMHMGRNFGMGTGLFYGSYAERISTEALTSTSIDEQRIWSFVPMDTTILFITDTIVQGIETIYVGESVPTTINVLTSSTETTVTTTQQREARIVENRVSYLEIPLLFDGHLTQGPWMLGARGGPSLGLLTTRRGALPNTANDGYTSLTEQQFRELTFGYTLRGYVRYRLDSAWQVGVEPALRGQLMNSLDEGDLSKISSAAGVMISLTYRLR